MKKTISFLIISFLLASFLPKNTFAEDLKFVVTAYYSPLPNQENYMRWTYEKEKILQWNWVRWASGKWVFSGMFAAPKNYNFGTKILLDWLWVGSVEDRWWAIVNAWERGYKHDRIDVWMWYGDEGLKRALAWWKRTVTWKILDNWTPVTFNYKDLEAPDSAVAWLKKEKTIFDFSIWKDSSPDDIKKLQKFLSEGWIYFWEIDGVYNNEIVSIIFDFQLANGIVSSENDFWAWYWWTKTRATFQKKVLGWELKKSKNIEKKEEKKSIDVFASFFETEENIKEVEKIFLEMWFYKWELTWKKENLQKIVYDFQVQEKIISAKTDIWAGYFWPKTRETLKEKYEFFQEQKILNFKKEMEKAEEKNIFSKEIEEKIKNFSKIKKWDVSSEVRTLQEVLSELWYFNEKATAIFWDKTEEAIINFQLKNNLIDKKDSVYAWILWEKTIGKIKENLVQKNKD